jgi:hypothetical protein
LHVFTPSPPASLLINAASNAADRRFGDDGKTLYMTAQGSLYRMPLKIPGIQPSAGVGDLSQAK